MCSFTLSKYNTVFHRIVNTCATMLRQHGEAYVRWTRGETSRSIPLRVLQAALTMPPPLDGLSRDVRPSLADLAARSLRELKSLEASTVALQAEVDSLQPEITAALLREGELDAAVQSLTAEVRAARSREAELVGEVELLRLELQAARRQEAELVSLAGVAVAAQRGELAAQRRADELRILLEASQQQHLAQHAADRQLITEQQAQLEQAAQSAAAQETELRRRPRVDVAVLRRCLVAVADGQATRYARRDARQLLNNLS